MLLTKPKLFKVMLFRYENRCTEYLNFTKTAVFSQFKLYNVALANLAFVFHRLIKKISLYQYNFLISHILFGCAKLPEVFWLRSLKQKIVYCVNVC